MVANRKPEGTRQDNSSSRALATVTAIAGRSPAGREEHPPGTGWLKSTKEQWGDFWESEISRVVNRAHLPAVYRLFELRDLHLRALRSYKRSPLVDGSQGQPVANPAIKTAQSLESSILALEDRLGLSPKAQANLGIALGNLSLTAAELNRMAEEDDDDDDGGDADARGASGAEPHDVVEADWVQA